MSGHPARSAARLRIEIEWEIWHMDLSLPSILWKKLCPKVKQTEALKLLWQLLANVLFAGTYRYWQQMKTTEDLEGLKFS